MTRQIHLVSTSAELSDDEELMDLFYTVIGDLRGIDGVDLDILTAAPQRHQRGALGAAGMVLKSLAPGAVAGVTDAISTRLTQRPEIELQIGDVKLSARNISPEEYKSLLLEVLSKIK
ncbi:MAG: hypothetical protein AAFY65_05810 [Pseudomonadota bacterium]